MLIFKDRGVGRHKWYARTPTGEFAFSDTGGLYQWHQGQRTDYSGGDRQHSSDGRMWNFGGGNAPRPTPAHLGLMSALDPARKN